VTSTEGLRILQEKYFELSFLDTFNNDFFKDNQLIIILQNYSGGTFLSNEKIDKNNGKYIFITEVWGIDMDPIPACSYTALYLLKISSSI
jgi:hypothetical protein